MEDCGGSSPSNIRKIVKTPGGKLVYQVRAKTAKVPSCGDCGNKLAGIPALRPYELSRVSKRVKHVSRAYGGSRCGVCVRSRIVRAFLVEEQKVVKHVLKKQQQAQKKKAQK
eukprot:TRINITY_DN6126_c0_g3_i1.p3 TRINITY_DN6126_c0_g3~~TRINITY_DN6126_c0_g3_i1.p3  ORF type:complete len:112 (-),score=27.35 TRINITY_DN6126_c0_g3_i1:4-339(-)